MSAGLDKADREPRLLRHLREEGAFALDSPFGCGRIALYRTVRGATLGAGYVPASEADELVASGRAGWMAEGGTRRLRLAEPGADTSHVVATLAVEGKEKRVLLDERESPLLWLSRRRGKDGKPQIAPSEFAAGELFRADLTLAQMLPRVTVNWDAALVASQHGPGRDPASASDASLAARQRVRLACKALGPEMSGLAIDVCGFLKGLDQVERERGWPARSAKIVLRLALSALAAHYGVVVEETGAGRRRTGAWRAADARPAFPVAEAR